MASSVFNYQLELFLCSPPPLTVTFILWPLLHFHLLGLCIDSQDGSSSPTTFMARHLLFVRRAIGKNKIQFPHAEESRWKGCILIKLQKRSVVTFQMHWIVVSRRGIVRKMGNCINILSTLVKTQQTWSSRCVANKYYFSLQFPPHRPAANRTWSHLIKSYHHWPKRLLRGSRVEEGRRCITKWLSENWPFALLKHSFNPPTNYKYS